MFKTNNKNSRATSTYFTTLPSVSMGEFEQVNVSWETNVPRIKLPTNKQNKDTYDALISIRLWIIDF